MNSRANQGALLWFGTGLLLIADGFAQAVDQPAPVLEEIIVTAERRGDQSLQDLAMSAAALSSELIDRRNLVGMDDYLRTIAGVTYQEYGAGRSTIVVRGISADPQESVETTGIYVNETSLTGLGDFGNSGPDLKLVDVARVEILRGPQGTLYGASSLGGTVRILAEPPRHDAFSAELAVGLAATGELGGSNDSFEGILNVPLVSDVLAIRAVAYQYDNSGYFRNVAASDPIKLANAAQTGALVLDRDDVGSSDFAGGRISVRWTPTTRLGVDLMLLDQDTEQEGNPYQDLALGEFEQARYSRSSTRRGEYTDDDLGLVNLLVDYDWGDFSVISSTSWIDYENTQDWDVGQFWTFLYGDDAPIFIRNDSESDNFVQELRVTSQWDRAVNFLAGVYYEDAEFAGHQVVEWDGDPSFDPFGGALMFEGGFTQQREQLAFFGELSWSLRDDLLATVGIRRFSYETRLDEAGQGFVAGDGFESTKLSEEDGENYKINLSFAPNDNSLYYAQWAQGFNPGYPIGDPPLPCDRDNDGLVDGLGLPYQDQINSDSLDSYEIGGKLSFSDGRVQVRGAAYYNEWTDIPILLVDDCAIGVPFNAGEAMTRGIELEGSAQLNAQWRLDFSLGHTHGELTSDAPALGQNGDRLPGTPEYNAALGVQYDFSLQGQESYLRGDLAHVGGFYNNLQEQGPEIGDYTTFNLSAGMRLKNWDLQLYVQNLGNTDAATWIYRFEEYPSAFVLRPRTIGLNVRYFYGR